MLRREDATPTPATDGKSVFVFYPEFGLAAYDIDGKDNWKVELGPLGGIQGMAQSPIVVDGRVILLVDTAEQAWIAAYDGATGKQAWKVDRPIGFLGSYSTPVLYKPASGPEQIIVAGAMELTGYQARTGERLWWTRGPTYGPAVSPLVAGDSVYTMEPASGGGPNPYSFATYLKQYDKKGLGKIEVASVGEDTMQDQIWKRILRSMDKNSGNNDGFVTEDEFEAGLNPKGELGGFVRTRIAGKGDVEKKNNVWRHTKGVPYTTGPVLYEGALYVIRNGGILVIFDPEKGTVIKEQRLKDAIGEYYSQPVAADGKVYLISKDGKTTVLAAGKEGEVVSSGDLGEDVIATPAISDGRIFVRTETALYCFANSKS